MNQFNWDQAFTLDFDLNNGLSKHADTTKRYLSQMKNMYQDQNLKMNKELWVLKKFLNTKTLWSMSFMNLDAQSVPVILHSAQR